jgi:cellulose biosynthesis protein BcsQ
MARNRPFRITVFNHKGGVGKTTLTVNIGAALASMGKRVLLVDSDPQCNLTSYLLSEEIVDDLLDNSDSEVGRTLWTALGPVMDAGPPRKIRAYQPGIKNLYLMPGDIRLSEFELYLHDLWANCFKRYPGAYRGTTALSSLITDFCAEKGIDFVFYDAGPNIGPLNRIILLDCDYFIIPAACDLFSVRGLKSLGFTLTNWITDWSTLKDLAPDNQRLLKGRPRFLGHIPQRFRTYSGSMTTISSNFFEQFEKQILKDVIVPLRRIDPKLVRTSSVNSKLGSVRDFASLAQQAQEEGVPLWEARGDPVLREAAKIAFSRIARRIVNRTGAD